jgi:hypothetical protein
MPEALNRTSDNSGNKLSGCPTNCRVVVALDAILIPALPRIFVRICFRNLPSLTSEQHLHIIQLVIRYRVLTLLLVRA